MKTICKTKTDPDNIENIILDDDLKNSSLIDHISNVAQYVQELN